MARFVILAVTVVTALALASAALAGSGKSPGYQGPGETVQGELQQGVAGVSTSGGVLPLTGTDLTFIALGGAALILAGTGFYRLSRRRQ